MRLLVCRHVKIEAKGACWDLCGLELAVAAQIYNRLDNRLRFLGGRWNL